MARVNLRVPFDDKDAVKRLGARWDPTAKTWYVPDGLDPAPFGLWLIAPLEINLRAETFFIGHTRQACWKCQKSTRVFTLVLAPSTFRYIERYDDDTGRPEWWSGRHPHLVSSIEFIENEPARRAIEEEAPTYRPSFIDGLASRTYENYCEACNAKQGHWHMYGEPTGPFFHLQPGDYTRNALAAAQDISIKQIDEKLLADAVSDYLPEPLFRAMSHEGPKV